MPNWFLEQETVLTFSEECICQTQTVLFPFRKQLGSRSSPIRQSVQYREVSDLLVKFELK